MVTEPQDIANCIKPKFNSNVSRLVSSRLIEETYIIICIVYLYIYDSRSEFLFYRIIFI